MGTFLVTIEHFWPMNIMIVQKTQIQKATSSGLNKEGLTCHCCGQDNNWSADPHIVEALTYAPGSFDESHTLDTERSHVRYSRLVVHSGTAMNRPRQRSWEQWLRGG